jgi:hypothetical protein
MVSAHAMRALLLSSLLITACSAPTGLCDKVKCATGKVCDPVNGLCVADDAGTQDAGVDAGTDAGTDGGRPDAGLTCDPTCTAPQKCDPNLGRCVSCLTNRDCACPTPVCVSGTCLAPVIDPDAGVAQPIPGESCVDAAPIALSGCTLPRTVTFQVDLASRNDDDHGVCSAAGGGGRDLVYLLTIDQTYDIDVTVAPAPGSMAEPVVYVRKAPCVGGQELACFEGGGGTASVHLKSRPAGDYAVFLDTYDAASGGLVNFTITLSAPTTPGNESCLTAELLPTDGGTVRVDLTTASDDEPTSCNTGGNDSHDVVWRFQLTSVSDVIARAAAVGNPDAGITPIIELRGDSCAPADKKACSASTAFGPVWMRVRSLPAGTYYAVLETWDGGATGPVDFSIAALPPSPPLQNDTCASPRDVVFSDGGTFTEFDIDTSGAA